MTRSRLLKLLAVALPTLALIVSFGIEPDDDRLDDGNECICPHVYAPVYCQNATSRGEFSNGCFAGCAGFTADDCRPAGNSLSIARP